MLGKITFDLLKDAILFINSFCLTGFGDTRLNIPFLDFSELDINILHSFLLKDVFNIDTNNQDDLKYLSYLRGNKSPVEMLKKQEYEFVCFVNPPSLEEVFRIAEGGEVMPQKSTYFFPKVYSGLVTRCF